jgi:hypothetical protein
MEVTTDMFKPKGLWSMLRALKWPASAKISIEVVASTCSRLRALDVEAGGAEGDTTLAADTLLARAVRTHGSKKMEDLVRGVGYGATFLPSYATAVTASGGRVEYWTVDGSDAPSKYQL